MTHDELIQSCGRFLNLWHENERWSFERATKNLAHDVYNRKRINERRDWICLDKANGPDSWYGVFMVRKADAQVFDIKAYGRPNLRRPRGDIGDIITKLALANVDQETVEPLMLA